MNRFLLFAVLLLAGQAQAYVILESKYHVEVKPGVFEDQLVLKCDNGRHITVPWEARLSESCGEVIIPRTAAAGPASPKTESQERQKEILMSRVREQYGNVDEQHVTAQSESDGSGPDGAEPHFSPQMREILKRYEICRKNTKGSPSCAAERNQAMAALSAQPSGGEPAAAESAAVEPQPTAKGKATKHKQAAAKPVSKPEPMPANTETSPASAEAEPQQTAMPSPPPAATPDRTASQQKIADDYARCMRAKPKFECETARAAALKALDIPGKPKSKSKAAARAPQSPDVATN